jgi:hypothetical protein
MKQKDIGLIMIVVFVSAVFSLFISNAIFASSKNRQQQVEIVQPISASFSKPDPRYFNAQAVDPTKQITIGQSANTDPFSSSTGAS